MVKHITFTAKLLLIVSLVLLFTCLMWLRQAERSLSWAKPSILRALAPANGAYQVAFDEASIDWRDWSQLGLLRITHLTTTGPDGKVFASLPELFVSLDPLGFLPSRHLIHTLYLQRPQLLLTRGDDAVLRVGVEGEITTVPVANILNPALPTNPSSAAPTTPEKPASSDSVSLPKILEQLPFRALEIKDATITLTDRLHETTLQSNHAYLRVSHRHGLLEGRLDLPFTYNKTQGHMSANLTPSIAHATTALQMHITKLPARIANLMGIIPEDITLRGLVNGELTLVLNQEARPQTGTGEFSSQKMRLTAPAWFDAPLPIRNARAQWQISNQGKTYFLSALNLTLPDTTITASARATQTPSGWGVKASASLPALDMASLRHYWPLPLAPASRQWVISSIPSGMAKTATLTLNLTPESLTAEQLPSEALDAMVTAENLTVRYLDGFPPIENVNGIVHFTGNSIESTLTEGKFLEQGQIIKGSTVRFPDLYATGTPMEVALELSASASDAATLLQQPVFTFDDALKLNPSTLTGTIKTALNLNFKAFSGDTASTALPPESASPKQPDFSQVQYRIESTLSDIAQKSFANNFDLSAINGALYADNEGMNFQGTARIKGSKEGFTVTATQKTGEDVALNAKGTIYRSQFNLLRLPDDSHFGAGGMAVDAQMWIKKNAVAISRFIVDFRNMELNLPEISWSKPKNAPARFSLNPRKSGSYQLDFISEDLNIRKGSITLAPDLTPTTINLPSVTNAKNDFAFSYKKQPEGFDITLQGRQLDASAAYAQTTGDGLLADFPPISLTLALDTLILTPSAPIRQLNGTLHCRARCEKANMTATTGEAAIHATISSEQGQRALMLTASNAGDFLRGMDFTDRVFGGKLTLKGTYDDTQPPAPLKGNLFISHYTLKNSQILGRILSIGSLTGLANALTGSGIAFDKFKADFTALGGNIRLQDGRTSGTALGLTVKGKINTNQSTVALKGVVVPAYFFNSLLGKIPLIGQIAGGDGEGLVAVNYSLDGASSDPDVFVNPFSLLTPGFLRGIWGGEDQSNGVEPTAPAR